ncbi:MAG: hypothetical protein EBW55_03630, partial [Betaproteobacteria bacterium]|nr:hypothetical protein [Betaproteobacteria bacterium]
AGGYFRDDFVHTRTQLDLRQDGVAILRPSGPCKAKGQGKKREQHAVASEFECRNKGVPACRNNLAPNSKA